jgi:hypothetical protein
MAEVHPGSREPKEKKKEEEPCAHHQSNVCYMSVCVGDRPICRYALNGHHDHSQRVTIPYAVYIQFDPLMMSIILLETCRRL